MYAKPRITLRHVWAILLVCGLILVRTFEDILFYDPLLEYYKADFTSMPWPEMDSFWLALSLFFRYFLNTVLSLAIIYVIFKNAGLVRFTAILYGLFFVILIIAFFVVLSFSAEDKMLLFYIRRFIIQPIFLLLFVPAFYFQQLASKKNNVS